MIQIIRQNKPLLVNTGAMVLCAIIGIRAKPPLDLLLEDDTLV